MITEQVENYFRNFLQSKVTFEIGNKIIKRGKLILIAVKDFHIFLVLQSDGGDIKQFIIPFPFDVTRLSPNEIALDYTLKTLSFNNNDLLLKLRTSTRKKNTRFFDSIVRCKMQ